MLKLMIALSSTLIFSGCVEITPPQKLSIPIIGDYYHNQRVVIKKKYIHSAKRVCKKLPPVHGYTVKHLSLSKDGKTVSLPAWEYYKANKVCKNYKARVKQYERIVK